MIDEGYTKYECEWAPGPAPAAELVAELNAWRNRLYEAGLIGYYAKYRVGYGNVSIRLSASGIFLISGTQTGHFPVTDENHYSRVTGFDIDANRVRCEGPVQASSEALTHAAVYALDPAIGAVVHVHDAELWKTLINRCPTTASDVSYGTPGMARELVRLYRATSFARDGIAVMGGHDEGLLSIGQTIEQAAERILVARMAALATGPSGAA